MITGSSVLIRRCQRLAHQQILLGSSQCYLESLSSFLPSSQAFLMSPSLACHCHTEELVPPGQDMPRWLAWQTGVILMSISLCRVWGQGHVPEQATHMFCTPTQPLTCLLQVYQVQRQNEGMGTQLYFYRVISDLFSLLTVIDWVVVCYSFLFLRNLLLLLFHDVLVHD